jgi:hypothetical protein
LARRASRESVTPLIAPVQSRRCGAVRQALAEVESAVIHWG